MLFQPKIYKNILKIEEQRKQYKLIKILRRLDKKKSVLKTTYMENGQIREIIEKKSKVNVIIQQNKKNKSSKKITINNM